MITTSSYDLLIKHKSFAFSDLDDGRSKYSCLELPDFKTSYNQNGRFCSRFMMEETPRDDLAKKLRKLVEGEVDVDGNFTYCRCRGQLCNKKEESEIKCYSTTLVDENTRSLNSISNLEEQNFFENDRNLILCPSNITQCHRYGK